jgi:3-hydroxyisobutyrate dehydrogenase-like beta-hydroxyacid dehydrogenase
VSDRIGFIGLGIMGSRMAANLRRAGFDLTVWNRTTATAERWAEEHGAAVAGSPAAVGEASDIVITMVVDGSQVEAVLLGPEGVVEGAERRPTGARATRAPLLCVDMSTIGRSAALEIGASLVRHGGRFMDAPVTGSSPKAEDGTLTIMAGGEESDFERARPLFEAMGESIVHVGPLGDGQMVKLINNAVAAVNTAAAAEALIAGERAGLDLDALLEVIGSGSGSSAMLALKAAPMRARDYTTLFKLEHMLKDLRLCLREAEAVGIRLPLVAEVERILAEAQRRGFGEEDFAALFEVVAGD